MVLSEPKAWPCTPHTKHRDGGMWGWGSGDDDNTHNVAFQTFGKPLSRRGVPGVGPRITQSLWVKFRQEEQARTSEEPTFCSELKFPRGRIHWECHMGCHSRGRQLVEYHEEATLGNSGEGVLRPHSPNPAVSLAESMLQEDTGSQRHSGLTSLGFSR